MPKQLTFSQEHSYKDDDTGITLPVVLGSGNASVVCYAKVDTGSEICLFSLEDGQRLGLSVDTGLPITIGTLGGPLQAFGHEISLQTENLVFHSLVYFAKYPGLKRNILGRRGWLRNIRIAVIDYDNLLYLSPYDE